jgi:hypothetical protein
MIWTSAATQPHQRPLQGHNEVSWPPGVQELIAALVRPSDSDVLRAKQALLRRTAGGTPEPSSELQWVLVDDAQIPRESPRESHISIPRGVDPEVVLVSTEPHIERVRLRIACQLALAELAGEGLLIEVDGPANVYETVPVNTGGQSGGVRVAVSRPRLSSGYQRSRRYRSDLMPILDADIFSADLGPLGLDQRGLQYVREALEAFRRGLYLSCVNLLGAVSEGAWWRVGEALRGRAKALDDALDDDRVSAAHLIRVVADELAKLKGMKSAAPELHAHATYLRELRNYGIHPRAADPEANQEYAFTEAGCALLLLETHRYLERLASIPGVTRT